MLAGTYLAEYGRYRRLAFVVRFINDILLSAPSIVIGLFIYEIVVAPMGHFSGYRRRGRARGDRHSGRRAHDRGHAAAGAQRACAKPAPRSACRARMVIQRIAYRAARAGIVTGVLLAVARVSGETAPLLFTALNNQFWSTQSQRADGEPAGGDLPVRAEPL